ncbi:hypothetical protein J2S04_000894 [Alicyclobacillus tengchongensis]|uniref:Uncharacterized protein n=2 Tax=Alicyclobacillus tolerans TaxID=90970 RepID=A0ABT9LUN4_9BACL|nr:hypothetical protein [Alicyclobacillus tengchongensis]SHK63838.1 hypothetical protein SAMN05443507_11850 [Alicyclobacillus montanus]
MEILGGALDPIVTMLVCIGLGGVFVSYMLRNESRNPKK